MSRHNHSLSDQIFDALVVGGGSLDEHLSHRVDHANRLWLLINAELWYRMMILGETRESLLDGARATEAAG